MNEAVIGPRAYPSNQMLIHWPYRGNNYIHVMMPEGVGGRRESEEHRSHLFNGWRTATGFGYRSLGDGEWENSFDEPGVLQFRGRCHPIEARVELELALTNDTKQVWHDVSANVCVSLAAAPQFADPGLERTFYAAAEGLKPVVREGVSEWAHGFIAVASEDGAATIAYGWPVQEKPGRPHVGDPALACVHANPHYGTLEPGQPVVQRGVIYTLLGTPADAYQQFRMEQLQATSGGDTKNRKN